MHAIDDTVSDIRFAAAGGVGCFPMGLTGKTRAVTNRTRRRGPAGSRTPGSPPACGRDAVAGEDGADGIHFGPRQEYVRRDTAIVDRVRRQTNRAPDGRCLERDTAADRVLRGVQVVDDAGCQLTEQPYFPA